MKKKWSILLTANLLSALASPLMVHAVTTTTQSKEIIKNIAENSQTSSSEIIEQSDLIKQSMNNIQETMDTVSTTDTTTSPESSIDTSETTTPEINESTTQESIQSRTTNNVQKARAAQNKATTTVVTGKWGSVSWEFDKSTGILTFTSSGKLGIYRKSPWARNEQIEADKVKKIVFKEDVIAPQDCTLLFGGTTEPTSVGSSEDILGLCEEIVGIEKINTSHVTNMYSMFYKMNALRGLDLSSWDVSSVTDMSSMFEEAFSPSKSNPIVTLDISSFNVSYNKPTMTQFLFKSGINRLVLGKKFQLNEKTPPSMSENFPPGTWYSEETGVDKGSSLQFLNWYAKNPTPGVYTKYNPVEHPQEEVLKWGTVPYKFDESTGVLTFTGTGTFDEASKSPWNRTDGKAIESEKIKKIVFTDKVSAPSYSKGLFSWYGKGLSVDETNKGKGSLVNLESFEGLNRLDTSKVTNMDSFFSNLLSVKNLDLSNFDTRNVTDMNGMFYKTRSIESLNLNHKLFDTSKVTKMSDMFSGMSSLVQLDISKLNTSSATTFSGMFKDVGKMTELDLTPFKTSNVTTMYKMFNGMSSLEKLNISSFDTSKVTTMEGMFLGLKNINSINVSHFNTSKVVNMKLMFSQMIKLYELDLGKFDFSKVSNKETMFLKTPIQKITLPATFSDPNNTTKLTDVPDDTTYNGNWVNFNDKSKKLGQTLEFLKATSGKAGTYIWGEKAEDMLKWGEVPYTFDEKTGKLTFVDGGTLGDYTVSPWNRTDGKAISASAVKTIEFTKPVKTPANSRYLFSGKGNNTLTQLSSFTGLNYIDTTNATNMSYMFYGLSSLESLNVSSFDTSNVTDMTSMFEGLRLLKELDISSFNTKKVHDMKRMFNNNQSMAQLIYNKEIFDTSNVRDMSYMFNNMYKLENLNVSGFNTSKVTNMYQMFRENRLLKELDLSNFDFTNVTNKQDMFLKALIQTITLPATFSDSNNITQLNNVLDDNTYNGNWVNIDDKTKKLGQTKEFLTKTANKVGTYTWGKKTEDMLKWGTVPYEFDENTGILTFVGGGTFATAQYSPWSRGDKHRIDGEKIKKIVFTKEVYAPSNSYSLFAGVSGGKNLTNLTTIEKLSYLNTSNTTSMNLMFNQASSLTDLDLSSFNTSKVTDMSGMFDGVSSLTELNLSSFDTSNVKTMKIMFRGMNALNKLDIFKFDTKNVTNMSEMFHNVKNLSTLNFGKKFDTSNVTNMYMMFDHMESLKNLDVSSFNTQKVTDMTGMFDGVSSLTELDLSSFDTSKVETMKIMFRGMNALNKLDISNFDTRNVTNMSEMFNSVHDLSTLNFGEKFDTSNVTNMYMMFANMTKLTSLDLGGFNFTKVSEKLAMFSKDLIQEITLPATFSDPSNSTKLNKVPNNAVYNGNWVNINDKNKRLGQTNTFLNNFNGEKDAGTYVWGKNSQLSLVEVPTEYNFGDKNMKQTIPQLVKPESLGTEAVKVLDTREQQKPWSLTIRASELETDTKDILSDSAYYFKVVSTGKNNMPLDGQATLEKQIRLMTDNTPQTVVKVDDSNKNYGNYTGNVEDMKLFIPKNTGKLGEKYKGTITWSLDNTPSD